MDQTQPIETFTAFAGHRCLASGALEEVLLEAKKYVDRTESDPRAAPLLVFEDRTGSPVDFDLHGTPAEALERLAFHPLFASREAAEAKRTGPGRPKLGVISREVSLLPRHWDWLEQQRGGISVTLRALVEEARKRGQNTQLARKAREAAGKFMWTIAGDLPNFEEAARALYAKDEKRLEQLIRRWPKGIKEHVERLVGEAARLEALAALDAHMSP